jgi:uncharacterized protein
MTHTNSHAAGTPSWVDLMTPDLDKALAFYGPLFGWEFSTGPAETGYYTMCRKGGRNAAGLGQLPQSASFPPAWALYFATEDVDAACERVRQQGGQVGMGPMDVMEQGRMAICADPTGAHFGFWQPRNHKGAGVVDEHGAMVWHEVNTRHGEKARDFYAAVLLLEPRKMEGIEYWTLHRGEKAVAGVLQMNERWPADMPPHWMNYFAVDDTDAAVKKVAELGGKVHVPPFDTSHGRLAVVSDPAGATFTVIKPSELALQQA